MANKQNLRPTIPYIHTIYDHPKIHVLVLSATEKKDRLKVTVQTQVLKKFGFAVNAINTARLCRAAVQYPEFGLGCCMYYVDLR